MQPEHRYWFAAKRYGWGWGLPLTWQGWVVYAAWVAASVEAGIFFKPAHSPFRMLVVLALIASLIGICYWKGEPPRWRWGKD